MELIPLRLIYYSWEDSGVFDWHKAIKNHMNYSRYFRASIEKLDTDTTPDFNIDMCKFKVILDVEPEFHGVDGIIKTVDGFSIRELLISNEHYLNKRRYELIIDFTVDSGFLSYLKLQEE